MAPKDHTYRIPGGRSGILLIHNPCSKQSEIHNIANILGRASHTIVCPQLTRGTQADMKTSTWQDWLASCETALDELRQTCDTVVVGGLSTGALLSLVLAAKHPSKVDGLVLLAPLIWQNGRLIPWYARLSSKIFPTKIANSNAILNRYALAHAVCTALPSIKQPVLIVHAREDHDADLDNAWHLQRHLPGTVEMVVLDDSDPIVTVDGQRDVIVNRTLGFVDRVARKIAIPCQKRTPAAASAKPSALRPSPLQPITA